MNRNFHSYYLLKHIFKFSKLNRKSFVLSNHASRQFTQSSAESKRNRVKDENIDGTTHFGFQTVRESEKEKKVHKVFEDVAKSYDLMNDAMSVGIHRIWKDVFIERLAPTHGTRLLDMAGGTGDIAFRYLKYLAKEPNANGNKSHVTISDINQNMLDVGEERAKKLNLTENHLANVSIEWRCADAENLPFDDCSYTAYTIAFGIRNCTHIDKVLAALTKIYYSSFRFIVLNEAYRVLKPGGRFMCLEFSHLTNDTLQWLYDQYSFQVIPPMGYILAGQWQAYQYLVESIRKFPKQEEFKTMIEDAGFNMVQYENLTFGVVSIHSGFKL